MLPPSLLPRLQRQVNQELGPFCTVQYAAKDRLLLFMSVSRLWCHLASFIAPREGASQPQPALPAVHLLRSEATVDRITTLSVAQCITAPLTSW